VERVLLRSGTRLRARLRPRILEDVFGLVEAADLFFEDGTGARGVPFATFVFVD